VHGISGEYNRGHKNKEDYMDMAEMDQMERVLPTELRYVLMSAPPPEIECFYCHHKFTKRYRITKYGEMYGDYKRKCPKCGRVIIVPEIEAKTVLNRDLRATILPEAKVEVQNLTLEDVVVFPDFMDYFNYCQDNGIHKLTPQGYLEWRESKR